MLAVGVLLGPATVGAGGPGQELMGRGSCVVMFQLALEMAGGWTAEAAAIETSLAVCESETILAISESFPQATRTFPSSPVAMWVSPGDSCGMSLVSSMIVPPSGVVP